MSSHTPYTCTRCNYQSKHKVDMRRHLYTRKKDCPALLHNIELTDDIKIFILQNRVYVPPQPNTSPSDSEQKTINQTINNFNTMNNFVSNMDVIDKLSKLVTHTKQLHIGYQDNIRIKYEDDAMYLRNPKNLRVESVAMKPDDLMVIIDSVTKVSQGLSDSVEINVLYDNKSKKIRLYQDGVWDDTIVSIGLKKLVQSIQETYLDEYEQYLIIKSRSDKTHFTTKSLIKELIADYYKFISAFELHPFVKDKSNNHFRFGSSTEYDIEEEFMAIYTKGIDSMSVSEFRKIQKDVLDIIKGNTRRNIEELNKKVINLIQIDDAFKESMFSPKHKGPLSYIDDMIDNE